MFRRAELSRCSAILSRTACVGILGLLASCCSPAGVTPIDGDDDAPGSAHVTAMLQRPDASTDATQEAETGVDAGTTADAGQPATDTGMDAATDSGTDAGDVVVPTDGICPPTYSVCGSYCANLVRDPRNCGTCGHACDAGGFCFGGSVGMCSYL